MADPIVTVPQLELSPIDMPPRLLGPPARDGDLGTLGAYRVVGLLGQGGMGYVFRGEDDALGRPVALKVMKPDQAESAEAKARFVREWRAAAGLKSDYVVVIHAVGGDRPGEVPYLVMEHLDGRTLADWLAAKGGTADPTGVVRVARHALRGLAAVHAKGLIHRDIKPTNLWVEEPSGRVKLLDFGLAHAADAKLTATGRVMGTAAYMSLEQARGRPPVDARTDLYSLGVVLYQMLVGANPFDRGSYNESLFAILEESPPPPAEANPAVPPDLSGFVARLMCKDRAGRPKDAAEALAELAVIGGGSKSNAAARPDPLPSDDPSEADPPVLRAAGDETEAEVAPGVRLRFCWVPAGTAVLGSPAAEADRSADEGEREFVAAGFWLGKHLVTQAEWVAVVGGDNPSEFNGANPNRARGLDTRRFPVESVSWEDAAGFCNKASLHAGKTPRYEKTADGWAVVEGATGFRLPRDDEWEYACRGGRGNRRPFYFGDVLDGRQANCDGGFPYGTDAKGPSLGRPCAVDGGGVFPAHPWGLRHMHGNVMEWCENGPPGSKSRKMLCGGSWSSFAHVCRAAFRVKIAAGGRSSFVGFRVLLPQG